MSLAKITQVSGKAVVVPGDDIDTDRIIPARFMKCVTFDGLGEYFFYDVRKDDKGNDKPHNLNDPRFKGASILISGFNFGCGSSREHAPQAIYRAGFRAVIAGNYAEIFFGNSTQLGMPCVSLDEIDLGLLKKMVNENPDTEVSIDLEKKVVRAGEKEFPLEIREGARSALIHGKWDPIQDLLDSKEAVEAVAAGLPYLQ